MPAGEYHYTTALTCLMWSSQNLNLALGYDEYAGIPTEAKF